ncbi:uncharacterized protein LOC110961238 isoform X3 [Acanthochromis polyacanthus]|uniref:uncharacterized protein LOC110961238 isoform X3 n=1 Tax=Acanthochromis polyacanthus TaxID=80966 RepID=UPI0022340E8A|nr:uncharacterized protein LOC110961238 isoform X3 [Acanthochromis polyacanthus]
MELKSRDMLSFLLLLLGHTVAAVALPDLNLECTNDFIDRMFCQLERPNCSEYNLTVQSNSDDDDKEHCAFQQCDSRQCCCSVKLMLIYGESHTATVWKGGHILESKIISVAQSIKPKAPEIVSVDESNGNVEVMWKTDYEGVFTESLTAEVTYYEKDSTEKRPETVRTATRNGLDFYQIPRGLLKPNTAYMVRVRTFTNWSDMFSDSSREWEFKTSAVSTSRNSLLLAIIISLSVAAVILTAAIYGCYVRVKTKWWDTFAEYPDPDLLNFNKQEPFQVLKPEPPIISSVSAEPLISDDSESWSKIPQTDTSSGSFQPSSGINTGSSCLSYAITERDDIISCVKEALCGDIPGISLISPTITSPLADLNKDSGLISSPISPCGADGNSSGLSCFDNKTYSIIIPPQIMADSSAVQKQDEIPCDSGYHPLCSISSGINTTTSCDVLSRAEARNQGSDKAVRGLTNGKSEEASICVKNPFTCVPAESHSFLAVDDDYQAFPNLVGQPDALFSRQRTTEQEESLTDIPKILSSTVAPGFKNNGQSGQHLSELQTPFLSLMSAGQSVPVMTDSSYQCV